MRGTGRHIGLAVAGVAALAASACGPQRVPLDEAMERCRERARLAESPRGRVGMGVGSDGPITTFDVTIGSDFLAGRDPEQVYIQCVINLTGQRPTEPLGS